MDRETNVKVASILKDSALNLMDVVLAGMQRKHELLVDRVMWEVNRCSDWEKEELKNQVNRIIGKSKHPS
jgi:hypothetical protein